MIADKALYWASCPLVGAYTGVMLRMDVKMHTGLPQGAKIIAANHPSTTDPFFVARMLRQQSFILIKQLLFNVPVLGTYLRHSGHIPVAAGGGPAAIQAALAHLRAGHTIMIFPEGGLSPQEGGFGAPRTGVARLALMSGAPVVPVGIHLQRERLYHAQSNVRGESAQSRWYLRGPYNMTFGDPLVYHGDVADHPHVRMVASSVMHHIIELARESENRLTRAPGAFGEAFGAV